MRRQRGRDPSDPRKVRRISDLDAVTARGLLADKVEEWVGGKIDNLELDDYVLGLPASAESAVTDALWTLYDDFHSHPPSPDMQTMALLRRFAAFLRTDLVEAESVTRRVFFGLFK